MERILKALPHYLAMKKALEENKELGAHPFAVLEVVEENEKDPYKKLGYTAAINEAIQQVVKGK